MTRTSAFWIATSTPFGTPSLVLPLTFLAIYLRFYDRYIYFNLFSSEIILICLFFSSFLVSSSFSWHDLYTPTNQTHNQYHHPMTSSHDKTGDLPVETVPQIVLLTFDDSVNDLNKGLYMDLFEKGRVNPNGCPITATFYVSHEWTDYSQVQNLYSAGHEMASHTVS